MLINELNCIKSKYVQPGFKYTMDMQRNNKTLKYHSPSILELKFVNGQDRKYHMGLTQWSKIMIEMKYINNIIEFERALAG